MYFSPKIKDLRVFTVIWAHSSSKNEFVEGFGGEIESPKASPRGGRKASPRDARKASPRRTASPAPLRPGSVQGMGKDWHHMSSGISSLDACVSHRPS